MQRLRVSYPNQAVFIGPSPASGFHWMSYTGALNNGYEDLVTNHNLLHIINRVQSVSYGFQAVRTDVQQLDTRANLSRPALNSPSITLEFDYLQAGIINELRLGLDCNYARFEFPCSGNPYYSNNFSVNLLSGFMSRSLSFSSGNDPYMPLKVRDNRNIFVAVSPEEQPQFFKLYKERLNEPDKSQPGVDREVTGYSVMAFGNCYLESYRTQASVGDFPRASVSFTCENVGFSLSGSGINIPAVNTQTRQIVNNNKFVIPQTRDEGGPFILSPGDITLDIVSSGDSLSGLGINFRDIFITNYVIDMSLNREPLNALGYKLPVDRHVNFPVFVGLNFGLVVNDSTSGQFIDLLNKDSGYNVTIKLRNPTCHSPFKTSVRELMSDLPRHDGPVLSGEGLDAIRYDFKDAKFNGLNFSSAIGNNKSANLSFTTEINPDLVGKGFFISGLLNISKVADYLIDDEGFFIIDERTGVLVANLVPTH